MSSVFLQPNKIQLVYQSFIPLSFKPSISPYHYDRILLFSHGFDGVEQGFKLELWFPRNMCPVWLYFCAALLLHH